jgi:beta-1,4-galactosyltransferase 1
MYENIIVIPYRNREKHLDYFVKNTVPLIQTHLPNSKVVVVEQNEGKLFNRGAILNVGFKEYENKTKFFFTHDVDLNPNEKCITTYYIKEVNDRYVLGIYTSSYNTLGGIIKIKNETIHKINGFPNDIWGWGTEDKALQNRAEFYKIKKITNLMNSKEHPEYLMRFHDINDRELKYNKENTTKHYQHFHNLNEKEKMKEIMSSGLNNLKYTILERKMIHDIVEVIKMDI